MRPSSLFREGAILPQGSDGPRRDSDSEACYIICRRRPCGFAKVVDLDRVATVKDGQGWPQGRDPGKGFQGKGKETHRMKPAAPGTGPLPPVGERAGLPRTPRWAVLCGALASLCLGVFAPSAEAAPPTVTAAWTTEVAASSAKLHAEIDPAGVATTYHFNYITEAAYRANLTATPPREGFAGAAKAPSGADPGVGSGAVSQSIAGLAPETVYRYRVLVQGGGGTESTAHAFTTESLGGASLLLDDRGWEMVSPPEKNGGEIQGFGGNFGGDVLQAAAGGEAATFSSTTSFGEGAQGAPVASQYIARRGPGGWSTENITAATLSGTYGDHPDGVPYQLFSADLSAALLLSGVHCRDSDAGTGCPVANPPLPGSGAPAGYQNYYLRNDETAGFQALLTTAPALSSEQFDLAFAGASPDLRHVVLSSCAKLTPEATEQPVCESGGPNLYEWSEGALRLVNRLGSDPQGTSDAHLAAQSGAISTDGSRVYFTVGEEAELFLREGESGARPVSLAPAVQFQTATPSGAFAFFSKGGELFRYGAVGETSELIAEGVKGVLGASADGSRVYYATTAGLFLWTAPGTTTALASGPEAARPSDYPPAIGTARVSADGSQLAFLSAASLTGYDNTDQKTGEPDTEAYLYSAAGGGGGTLTCASCNPTGERPLGSSTIPGAIANGKAEGATQAYKPRDLAANGARLFFDSEDSLVLQDTNNHPDAYEWEAPGAGGCARAAGCIGLISSGRDGEASRFIDASASGSDAFFLTHASLVPSDPGSVDLYDAREGGGFPAPASPIPCEGDACQSLPPEPEDPAPGTLQKNSGNPPLHFHKVVPRKPHRHRRKGHHKTHRHAAHGRGGSR
jgi:hypothetical protein